MPEAKRNTEHPPSDIRLDGFEQIFAEESGQINTAATATGDQRLQEQIDKLLERFTELVSLSVDQRIENSRMATQLIENQRQLVATQQILIRLLERSIGLTKHISSIEERLPVLFELPRIVERLKDRIVKMEGIEVD
jgi:hypothetical protein